MRKKIILNDLAKEIYEIAASKGWHEKPVALEDAIANIHAELSEAWEEYRAGRRLNDLYGKCTTPNYNCSEGKSCSFGSCDRYKPEGIPAELADVIIRVLDSCVMYGIDIDISRKIYEENMRDFGNEDIRTFGKLINLLHKKTMIAERELTRDINNTSFGFARLIDAIYMFSEQNGIDIDKAVRIKMEYNKTRSYRHGGKVV